MENKETNHNRIKYGEDEISARAADQNSRKGSAHDESFKSKPRNKRLGWEVPQDEQMYESFNEIRKNQ